MVERGGCVADAQDGSLQQRAVGESDALFVSLVSLLLLSSRILFFEPNPIYPAIQPHQQPTMLNVHRALDSAEVNAALQAGESFREPVMRTL